MLGQQITSSGVMPLQRNVITSQFPFVPRPSSNYAQYGATIPNQPQLGLGGPGNPRNQSLPWTPAMSGLTTFNNLGWISDPRLGASNNPAFPSTITQKDTARPNSLLQGFESQTLPRTTATNVFPSQWGAGFFGNFLGSGTPAASNQSLSTIAPKTQFLVDNDPRIPPGQRGTGNKIIAVRVAGPDTTLIGGPAGFNAQPFANAPGEGYVGLASDWKTIMVKAQEIPEHAKVPPMYGQKPGTNAFPEALLSRDNAYIGGNFTQAPGTAGVGGLPKSGSVIVLGSPFNQTTPPNTLTLASTGANLTPGTTLGLATTTLSGAGSGMLVDVTIGAGGSVSSLTITVGSLGTGYSAGNVVMANLGGPGPNPAVQPVFYVGDVIAKTINGFSSSFPNFGVLNAGGQAFPMYPRVTKDLGISGARQFQPSMLTGGNFAAPDPVGNPSATVQGWTGGIIGTGVDALATLGGSLTGSEGYLYAFGAPTGANYIHPAFLSWLESGGLGDTLLRETIYMQNAGLQSVPNTGESQTGYFSSTAPGPSNNPPLQMLPFSSAAQHKPDSSAPASTGAIPSVPIRPNRAVNGTNGGNPANNYGQITQQVVLKPQLLPGVVGKANASGMAINSFDEFDYQVAYTGTYPM